MLRWIVILAALSLGSAVLGLGRIVPLSEGPSSLFLAVFALSATLLIGSFEAYETQAIRTDLDDR